MLQFSELMRLFAQKADNVNSINSPTEAKVVAAPKPNALYINTNLKETPQRKYAYVVGQERDTLFLVARDDLYLVIQF